MRAIRFDDSRRGGARCWPRIRRIPRRRRSTTSSRSSRPRKPSSPRPGRATPITRPRGSRNWTRPEPSSGKWETVSDIVFDTDGKRSEKVVRAPVSTLHNILLTPEDLEDLHSVQPFVLTTAELPKYLIRYLGREKLDEIGCYAFAVKPKKVDPGQRYFEGIVWVDDRDLQIVKSYGRGTGVFKKGNAYPKFETYREQIDGKYWFPTYTIANATLHFPEFDQRIKQTVRYEDYKQFGATTTITFGDEVDQPKAPTRQDKKTRVAGQEALAPGS